MITSFGGEYRFLSNFYPSPVKLEGCFYHSVEAAYQAAKTENIELRKQFQQMLPGDAKFAGKGLVLRSDWEEVKLGIMEKLLRRKFYRGGDLAERLLKTGEQELVEQNWWGDRFWGVWNGQGENHLGKLLMKIRQELRNETR